MKVISSLIGVKLSREELKSITGGRSNSCQLLCCGEIHDCTLGYFNIGMYRCELEACDIDYEVDAYYCQHGQLSTAKCSLAS